eukprot:UN28375
MFTTKFESLDSQLKTQRIIRQKTVEFVELLKKKLRRADKKIMELTREVSTLESESTSFERMKLEIKSFEDTKQSLEEQLNA